MSYKPVPQHSPYLEPDYAKRRGVRRAWRFFALVLLLVLAAEFAVTLHPHFAVEAWSFFYAWYGFLACVGIVVVSKFLGVFLKRPEDYYTQQSEGKTKQNASKGKAKVSGKKAGGRA